jgi:AbrB family looped-hinge helix DNA binding protein
VATIAGVLSVKVSTKHQIAVPSEARRRLGIGAGDRLSVEVTDDAIVLRRRPDRPSERLRGVGSEVWKGVDPVAYVRHMRDELER